MKKWLSLLCALIMVLSMLPAAIASADEMVTIKYVIPGSEKEDYATVIKAVNAKLAADLGIPFLCTCAIAQADPAKDGVRPVF